MCNKKAQMRLSPHRCLACGNGHDFQQRDLLTTVGAHNFTTEEVVAVTRLAAFDSGDFQLLSALEARILRDA